MPLSPSQRILLIKEIASRLGQEEWPLIDVTLKQFSLPWSDDWRGTQDAYVFHMIGEAPDESLIDLAQHVGFQFEEATTPRGKNRGQTTISSRFGWMLTLQALMLSRPDRWGVARCFVKVRSRSSGKRGLSPNITRPALSLPMRTDVLGASAIDHAVFARRHVLRISIVLTDRSGELLLDGRIA